MVCGLDAEADPTDLILYCISKAQHDAWVTVSTQQRGNRGVAWVDKPYPDPADSLYFKLFISTIHSIFPPARNLGSWPWAHFPFEALYSSLNWSLSNASSTDLELIYYRPPLTDNFSCNTNRPRLVLYTDWVENCLSSLWSLQAQMHTTYCSSKWQKDLKCKGRAQGHWMRNWMKLE